MVKIDKIYTRGGDNGITSLVDGSRVSKNTQRLATMGDVDEANAVIGLAKNALDTDYAILIDVIKKVQNDLCDLGADLATPGDDPNEGSLRVQEIQVRRLEKDIDRLNKTLKPLNSFILPGGEAPGIWLHLARTIVRRAERSAVALSEIESLNGHALRYLNRLSDLLFVMARYANDKGRSDDLWVPGKYGKSN